MSSIPQKQPPARIAVSSVGEQPGLPPAAGRVQVLGAGADDDSAAGAALAVAVMPKSGA